MPETAFPDSRWWPRRVSTNTAAAIVAGIVVLGVAVSPVVGGLVDWGMDGDLTPGLWEPSHWLTGALLSMLVLGEFGWPVVGLLATVTAVAVRCRAAPHLCASCGSPVGTPARRCDACGPLRPRRPRGSDWSWLSRALVAAVAIVIVASLALLVACGCAWVQLELGEDAFGRRAEAAAAAGVTRYDELNRYGSRLMWSVQHGYASHRD